MSYLESRGRFQRKLARIPLHPELGTTGVDYVRIVQIFRGQRASNYYGVEFVVRERLIRIPVETETLEFELLEDVLAILRLDKSGLPLRIRRLDGHLLDPNAAVEGQATWESRAVLVANMYIGHDQLKSKF